MRKLLLVFLLTALTSPCGTVWSAVGAQTEDKRRVNVPYFNDDVAWAEASVFWFGRVDPPSTAGQNYADVRVAYTADELSIFVNVEDYYLWYDPDETYTSDLTDYEAVAIYLDIAHDRTASPQPDDFVFISALCLYECGDGTRHRREGQGTGAGWNMTWTGQWKDGTWASWIGDPAANNNDNEFDYGWWSYVHIPWSTVGLSGPPPEGTVWGLGVILYDRDDQPPAGAIAPQTWPENLDPDHPDTWGEMHFGLSTFTPPQAVIQGTTVIRRGLGQSTVKDGWVGGGGSCGGGHEGDPEHDNYGTDGSLFVANQSLIADFPCFSKSFLKFHLDPIPENKVVISATLSLHHWGNARGDLAQPSLIWLLTVDADWEENTLTWNNAPLVQENLSTTWVDVITPENDPGWPGVRYDWDATQAAAEAYAAGAPLNIALYTADTNFHSSKYLVSSDTGDWNEQGRPTLTVVWGQPVATVNKRAHPITPRSGEVVTYTITMVGNGHPLTLTDSLPDGLGDPGPIQVTDGNVTYNTTKRRVEWTGTPDVGQTVTIAFPVTVQISSPVAIVNTATLTNDELDTSTDTAVVIVGGLQVYLPTVMR